MKRRHALAALTAAALFATPVASHAQGYPEKPIRFIVPYPAGGGTDIMARMIGAKMQENWKQQVLVENKPGASGVIGNDLVAKAPPDGYTVLLGITTLVKMPHLRGNLPYDVFKDFSPVVQLALSANFLAVPANSPANNLKEFVALAKADPKTSYGTFGAGTTSHLHGELFNLQTGLKLTHVPFQGGAPLATNLMGGQVPSGFIDVTSARAHLTSGKMKFLAISGAKRYAGLPNVPTFAEEGLKDFEASGWFGVFLPANTPKDIVNKLAGEISRIMRLPDVQMRVNDIGLQPVESTPEGFAATMRSDFAVWGRVVKEANIKLDN